MITAARMDAPSEIVPQFRKVALELFTEAAAVEEREADMRRSAAVMRDYVGRLDAAKVAPSVLSPLRECVEEIDRAARLLRDAAAAYLTAGDLVDIAAQRAEAELRVTALHEAGHHVVAERLGYDVDETVLTSLSSGVCRVDADGASVDHTVAIAHAGAHACHSSCGCSTDNAIRDNALASLPAGQRGSTRWAGERLAERTLRSRRGQLHRYADRLFRRGRM